jgi:hypothetical protein
MRLLQVPQNGMLGPVAGRPLFLSTNSIIRDAHAADLEGFEGVSTRKVVPSVRAVAKSSWSVKSGQSRGSLLLWGEGGGNLTNASRRTFEESIFNKLSRCERMLLLLGCSLAGAFDVVSFIFLCAALIAATASTFSVWLLSVTFMKQVSSGCVVAYSCMHADRDPLSGRLALYSFRSESSKETLSSGAPLKCISLVVIVNVPYAWPVAHRI